MMVQAGKAMRGLLLATGLVVAGAMATSAQTNGGAPLTLEGVAFKMALMGHESVSDQVTDFYRARDYAPLWTGSSAEQAARRSALFEALSNAGLHGLPERLYDPSGMRAMLAAVRSEADRGAAEMALTRLYLKFAHDIQSGLLEPRSVDDEIVRRRPVRSDKVLLEHLMSMPPRHAMRTLAPQTPEYRNLMRAKMDLEALIAKGGWGPQVRAERLDPGDSGPAVVALRDRLIAMGFLEPTLSARFDGALEAAVVRFQDSHGLSADGIAGPSTLGEINVSPVDRLKSVVVALERERWLNLPEGRGARHVLVNLPDYRAKIIDDGKVTFETKSVIGARGHDRRTPEFSDTMEHMVINPTWYIPRSIVVGEYLPQLQQDPMAVSYLDIVNDAGGVVSRAVDFAQFTQSDFPFGMRQRPGPGNALGSVKFMFPNRHNIYLHDTPQQHLFSRETRAFSHGCIRLDDPHEFAYALLAPQSNDPVGTFQYYLRSGNESQVDLEQPIPVHLIYRTAFTEAKGPVQFRRDIYGRDAKLWTALANAGVVLNRLDG